MKAVSPEGQPLALTVNYSCHPTVLAGFDLGGDYPGVAMRLLEEMLPGTTTLFLQGTGGDQKVPNADEKNPFKFSYAGGPPRVHYWAQKLVHSVADSLENTQWEEITGAISTKLETVELPLIEHVIDIEGEGMEPFTGPERRMVRLAKLMLEAMDEHGNYKKTRTSEVHVLEIGQDYVQVGLNGEVDVPIGLRIKAQLIGRPVMVTSYTGPSIGYFPGYCQIPETGYETRTPYSPEAEDFLVGKAMSMISEGREGTHRDHVRRNTQ